jgi:hypothetical protein
MQEGVFVNCKTAQQREKASPPYETRIGIIRGCALVTFVAGCFALFTGGHVCVFLCACVGDNRLSSGLEFWIWDSSTLVTIKSN